MINEKKFNTLWVLSKYVYGLYPLIIGLLTAFVMINNHDATTAFAAFSTFASITCGILILTHWPRLGAYLMATFSCLGILAKFLQFTAYQTPGAFSHVKSIETSDVLFVLSYIIFALIVELKTTTQQK